MGTCSDFLFDVHFVDLENFQPLARFNVQKFADMAKFVHWDDFSWLQVCDSCHASQKAE